MIKSWRFRLALFLVLILAGIWIVPVSRWGIIGYLKREHFYQGRPTSYWRSQIEAYFGPTTFFHRLLLRLGVHERIVRPSILGPKPAAVPVFIELVKDGNDYVSEQAILALAATGPAAEDAIPSLNEALRGENHSNRKAAAFALGCIGPKSAPVLSDALGDERKDVRSHAALALGYSGGPTANSAIPTLMALLKDEDENLRYKSAETLGLLGPSAKSAVPALIALLNEYPNAHPADRSKAIIALKGIGPEAKAAVPILIDLMKDDILAPDAALALTQIDPEAAEKAGASRILSTRAGGPAADGP
jgi:HEAT repeat protein